MLYVKPFSISFNIILSQTGVSGSEVQSGSRDLGEIVVRHGNLGSRSGRGILGRRF